MTTDARLPFTNQRYESMSESLDYLSGKADGHIAEALAQNGRNAAGPWVEGWPTDSGDYIVRYPNGGIIKTRWDGEGDYWVGESPQYPITHHAKINEVKP